jgi:hypothetical protein
MNIFYIDSDPQTCAQSHNDKHTVKMIIEYAQLMSTAHRILDGTEYLDKTVNNRSIKRWRMNTPEWDNGIMLAAHVNHPSNIWVRSSKENYLWINRMWTYLLKEYTHRYGKEHKCAERAQWLYMLPKNIPDTPFTEPPLAMPDEYKVIGNAIQSYRNYYNGSKASFSKWTNREIPVWFHQKIIPSNEGIIEEVI